MSGGRLHQRREDHVVGEARARSGADAASSRARRPARRASSGKPGGGSSCGVISLTVWWPSGARDGSTSVGLATSSHAGSRRSARRATRGHARHSAGTPASPAETARGRRRSKRRRGRREVDGERGDADVERLDAVAEALVPASAGAMSSRCLTWIVETTASRAVQRSPSAVSTPAQRPPSTSSRVTRRSHTTVPPCSSMHADQRVGQRARAAARQRPAAPLAPEDDRVRERARAVGSRPARASGTPARAGTPGRGGSSNSWRTTSQALSAPRRCQTRSARVLGEGCSSDGPKPTGVNAAAAEDVLDLVVRRRAGAGTAPRRRARSARSPRPCARRSSHAVSCSPSGNATCANGSGSRYSSP